MAFFKKQGDNLSRAASIISGISKTPSGEPKPPVEPTIEPTVEPTVEPTDNIPPVEEGVADPIPPVEVKPEVPKPVETPEVTPEVTEEALLSLLSERLGRSISSVDDLKQKEVDPEVEALLKWKEDTGLSLSDWSEYNKDFSSMKDLDVAREILSQEFPNFTDEEIEYSLKDYIYDEDYDDDGDKMRKNINLKKFAKEGREKLESSKVNLPKGNKQPSLTKEQQEAINFANQFKETQAASAKATEDYNLNISKQSQSLEAIELNLKEGMTLKYSIPEETRRNLPKMVAEMPHWYNEDGSYNHANVVKDVAKVTNFDAMIQAAYNQGVESGKEGQIRVGANITIDGSPSPAKPTTKKGNIESVVSNITGGRQGSKLRFKRKK